MMSGTISHPGTRVDRTLPGFAVKPVSDYFESATIRPPQFAVATNASEDAAPLAQPIATPAWYVPVKRCFDFVAAVVLLIVAAPILLAGALLVKFTSRGPAFYRQVR